MSGTVAGGKAAAKTNKRLYGEDFYSRMGAKGGLAKIKSKGFGYYSPNKVKKLFGAKNIVAKEFGRVGGTVSKRRKKV